MDDNSLFKNLIFFFISLSICFVIQLNLVGDSKYNFQQYVILIPVLVVLGVYQFFFKKEKFDLQVGFIIILCLLSYFINVFKFGSQKSDIISLAGFILIFIMILLFRNIKDKNLLIKYFIYMFSILEVIVLFILIKEKAFFNISKTIKLREIFFTWPNYFAIMSSIKFGFIQALNNKKVPLKFYIILMILSFSCVVLSLSRTAMVMFIMIYVLDNIFDYIYRDKKIKMYDIMKFLLFILIIFIIFIRTINYKDSSASSAVERTLSLRIDRWDKTLELIKNNFIFGTGFRSTTSIVEKEIGSTHNDYIDILLKSGLILFIIICKYFLERTIVLYKNKEYGMLVTLLSIYASAIVQNPLKSISSMVVFSLLLSYSYDNNNEDINS